MYSQFKPNNHIQPKRVIGFLTLLKARLTTKNDKDHRLKWSLLRDSGTLSSCPSALLEYPSTN